jgi:hypothetical protein
VLSTSNLSSSFLSVFGFGPVTPRGYGIGPHSGLAGVWCLCADGREVGYNIKDNRMVFNVTSKYRQTRQFVQNLNQALVDMRALANAV